MMYNEYFLLLDDISPAYYRHVSEMYHSLSRREFEGPNESAAWDMYRYLRGEGM